MSVTSGFIVVGVDHTQGSRLALDFAMREGVAHGLAVEVVTAWQGASPDAGNGTSASARGGAVEMQDMAVRESLGRLSGAPMVTQVVVHDFAGKVLTQRCEGASMLVLGSGRKGALSRSLLGSVSEYCVRHAPVPVVVVPDPERTNHIPPPTDVASTSGFSAPRP